MQKLMERVDQLTRVDIPTRPSFFQLQYFLIGKESTHQARLKRVIDELRSRKRDVDAAQDEIAECLDRRQLLGLGQGKDVHMNPTDEPEVQVIKERMLERRMVALDRQIFDLRQVVAGKVEEMAFLVASYENLVAIQPLRPWDDREVQLEYWETKLRNEIGLRMQLKVPVDLETVRTAMSLPETSRLRQELSGMLPQLEKTHG